MENQEMTNKDYLDEIIKLLEVKAENEYEEGRNPLAFIYEILRRL